MGCNCGCGTCNDGFLGGLMGQTPRLSDCIEDYEVIPGARVAFGFNTGFASLNINLLGAILEREGLLYNTESKDVAGFINPYVAVEGYANIYLDSSCDFCATLWITLKDNGIPIKPETINCVIERITADTGVSQGPQSSLRPPADQPLVLPSFPSLPGVADVLPDLSCASKSGLDWAACQLGVTRTTGVFIGVSLALLGVLLVKGR